MHTLAAGQRRIHEAAIRLFSETGSTNVNVSELADYAGVARGTIYNNIESMDSLFEEVAANLASDMNRRVIESFPEGSDPVTRLASGIRLYIQRAHQEPVWGNFLMRFAYSDKAVEAIWSSSHLLSDVQSGLDAGRYQIVQDQVISVMTLIAGATVSAMYLVRQGLKTWREAGTDTAEFTLPALGVDHTEAHILATAELPTLTP